MKISIGSIDYTVEFHDDEIWLNESGDPDEKGDSVYGYVDVGHGTIHVSTQYTKAQQKTTLLHEVLHVIMTHAGILEQDEGLITALQYGLWDAFQRNPEFVTYITSKA